MAQCEADRRSRGGLELYPGAFHGPLADRWPPTSSFRQDDKKINPATKFDAAPHTRSNAKQGGDLNTTSSRAILNPTTSSSLDQTPPPAPPPCKVADSRQNVATGAKNGHYVGLAVGSSPVNSRHRREASDPGCLKGGTFLSGEISGKHPGSNKTSPPYYSNSKPMGEPSSSPTTSSGKASSSGGGSPSPTPSPTNTMASLAEYSKGAKPVASARIGNILGSAKMAVSSTTSPSSISNNNVAESSVKGNCSRSSLSSSSASSASSLRHSGETGIKTGRNGVKSNHVSPIRSRGTMMSSSNILNNGSMHKVDASSGNILKVGGGGCSLPLANNKGGEGNNRGTPLLAFSLSPEECKNAGNEQYKRGHFAEALALYDRAIALSPRHAAYHSNKAAALSGLGRLPEAVSECEEAVKLDPSYHRAHQRLAFLYLRLGLLESAKRHNTQKDCPDMQTIQAVEKHISKCIEAKKSADWKCVIKESDAAIVSGADSAPQLLGYKAEALLKLRRVEEADTVLSIAQRVESALTKLGVTSSDSALFSLRAQIDMSIGRFESAVAAAESAVQVDPRNPEVAGLLRKARAVWRAREAGNDLFKAGKFFEACVAYGEGLERDPANAVLLCNRAACRSKLRQWEKAVEDCDAALDTQPNYVKALMRRANCHTMLERWEDAVRDYEELRREAPEDMEIARGLFDAQVALKKSRGEEDVHKMKFGGEVEEVSSNDHFNQATSLPGLAVVEFNTRSSERCKEISSFLNQLYKRFPFVNFLKVDVDDNPRLAKTENVSFVPTFKFYKNGQKVKEILGPSQQALEYALKQYSF